MVIIISINICTSQKKKLKPGVLNLLTQDLPTSKWQDLNSGLRVSLLY